MSWAGRRQVVTARMTRVTRAAPTHACILHMRTAHRPLTTASRGGSPDGSCDSRPLHRAGRRTVRRLPHRHAYQSLLGLHQVGADGAGDGADAAHAVPTSREGVLGGAHDALVG